MNANKLITLSVRTGFHLVLSALSLPPGSEVIVSNINIPDMYAIIAAHGLKAIPVPVRFDTLTVSTEDIQSVISKNTRVILLSHLFGALMDTTKIAALAKQRGLLLIEDCAQAFGGYYGDNVSNAAITMFSFGLIKTNTAVSGAVIQIRDPNLLQKVINLSNSLPCQSTSIFRKKLLKVLAIKLLTGKTLYSAFYKWCLKTNRDPDEVLSSATRGIPGTDVLGKISYRPCRANIILLKQRLNNFNLSNNFARTLKAREIVEGLALAAIAGGINTNNTYWVLPVKHNQPEKLIAYLRNNGFDATQKASSLIELEAATTTNHLQLNWLVYLPCYRSMSPKDCNRLNGLLLNFGLSGK
ncbi:aminotransferase class V-fold PLP-dependent enzyme [Mucilaginibacter terrenus]|uniref:aminotransferase class V-fold PLP-dependent enzyme n=1 Tax=Mucilaginibacter terrenus TaxID=2482727 RepID=UPI00140345EA|nr:aminotransferase class V-fold PLP-dependent enzyme [Mucilaginibacter terrenus]